MLRWLKRRWSEHVPDWGAPLGRLGYVAMLEGIEAELGRRALPYKRNDATLAIAKGGKLVLPTLVRQYAEIPRAQWRQHTMDVIDAALSPPPRRRPALSFAAVRDQLRIQLAERAPGAVQRLLADGLHAVVVRARKGGVRPLSADAARDLDPDEVFAAALAQTMDLVPDEVVVSVTPSGVELHRTLQGTPFACAAALMLDRYLSVSSGRGALVAVPSVSVAMFRSLSCSAGDAFVALTDLAIDAGRLHAAAEHPVSRGVFWWREGTFERLDCAVDDQGEVHFRPGGEFERRIVFAPFESGPPVRITRTSRREAT